MIPPRFRRAVNDARPFGVHRFDVFGPKVGRPLTLYGLNSLYLWLRLEADLRVTAYCERAAANSRYPADAGSGFLGS